MRSLAKAVLLSLLLAFIILSATAAIPNSGQSATGSLPQPVSPPVKVMSGTSTR